MDWKSHPISIVRSIIEKYGNEVTFELSTYKYVPLSTIDQRNSFWVSADSFTENFLQSLLDSLEINEEVSLHSRVAGGSRGIRHIPMIDFTGEMTLQKLDILERLLPDEYRRQIVIFRSGKSYHGYIDSLIEDAEWYQFMGLLLLMNFPDLQPVTDARWIGHRLRGGYGALRLSCNTNGHTVVPFRIGTLDDVRQLIAQQAEIAIP